MFGGCVGLTAADQPTEATAVSHNDGALRTKEFVVMGYQGLMIDLRAGSGPYLSTLIDLLNVVSSEQPDVVTKVRSLAKSYPNIMDFADQILLMQRLNPYQSEAPLTPVVMPTGPSIYSGDKLENALNHLTRGMPVTVYLKNGQQVKGDFIEYDNSRLWLRGETRKSILQRDILAVDAPKL